MRLDEFSYAELDQLWIDAIRGTMPSERLVVRLLEFARDYVHHCEHDHVPARRLTEAEDANDALHDEIHALRQQRDALQRQLDARKAAQP